MTHPIISPRKLIEVALPLAEINAAAAKEKSIRHGHPSTLHLWWARRPLAAARAVIFAQMVNDPSWKYSDEELARPDIAAKVEAERERLFGILRDLVIWENTTNEAVLEPAREEIRKSWRETCEVNRKGIGNGEQGIGEEERKRIEEMFDPEKLPAFHDPFAGGGALPLEAQRLGLEAWASDLNPVAVLINKAMIEIPPKFAGRAPVYGVSKGIGNREEGIGNREEGIGNRGEGIGNRGEGIGNGNKGLQGSSSLAEGNEAGGGNLQVCENNASGRSVSLDRSDSEIGGIGSCEYSGGLREKEQEGVREIPFHSARIERGNGNVSATDTEPENGRNSDHYTAPVPNGGSRENAHRSTKKASSTLNPIPYSLFPEEWPGASGLAEDVRRYGAWMREEAYKRIGHLYPKVKGPNGDELTVIAWIWARTVKSPNPAFSHVDVPLVRSFNLSTKKGKEVWVEPVINGDSYDFRIRHGGKPKIEGTVKRTGATCIMSGIAMPFSYVRTEGKSDKMGRRLMAVVAEGSGGRVYLEPTTEHTAIADSVTPTFMPEMDLPFNPRDFKTPNYGLTKFCDLFTPRQLVALTTFSDLVGEAREKAYQDALKAGMADDGKGLEDGGSGARAYADAVAVYLAFAVDKTTDLNNSLSRWESIAQCPRQLFGRQAIPMVWDFAEANILSTSSGSWDVIVDGIVKAFGKTFHTVQTGFVGNARQSDAVVQKFSSGKVISTDPPYYDNIGYADLSDFFYIWLRRSLGKTFPVLFSTIAVPKGEELVATPYRHGSKEKADNFFLSGMTKVIRAS